MNQRILIVDDSKNIHALLKARLSGEPVELHSCFTSEQALTTAGQLLPDLILLDVDMPDTNGFEVCRRLKAQPATMNVPVVFLTGAGSTDEKIRGLELGAVDYITKPFEPAELRARVRAALRTKYLLDLLNKKAMIDGLTGLWNRTYFDQTLAAQLSLARRSGQAVSVVICDLDHFKVINDRCGHLTGDEALRVVAACMQATCRIEDVVCRIGGEEFGIIVPSTPADRAYIMAERLRKNIEKLRLTHRGTSVPITCSFGIADLATCGDANLVQAADAALYRAKQNGRNRIEMSGQNEPAAVTMRVAG
ncbi:MAG TPA: diguanylate cyclase [Tepidisphaeraceae bacterium]|nr:diguanylate cyclase [Tepidisphaeraceae bacterium]